MKTSTKENNNIIVYLNSTEAMKDTYSIDGKKERISIHNITNHDD